MTVLIVAGLLLASLLSRRVRKVLKFARKFLAGHPLDGYHRTNATFTRGATKVLDPRGRAHPWHWRPGWQRGAVRLGAILLAAGVTWGALPSRRDHRHSRHRHRGRSPLHRVAAVPAGTPLAVPGMGLARHHPQPAQVRPGHVDRSQAPLRALLVLPPPRHALTDKIGAPPTRLKIEPDRSRVEVGVPAEFTGSDVEQGAVIRAVTAKLAIPDAERSIQKLLRRQPGLKVKPEVRSTHDHDASSQILALPAFLVAASPEPWLVSRRLEGSQSRGAHQNWMIWVLGCGDAGNMTTVNNSAGRVWVVLLARLPRR